MKKSEKLILNEIFDSAHQLKIATRGLEFGQIMKMIRRQLGISQKNLAKLAKVPQSTISRLEGSKREPRLPTLRRVLSALFCDIVIVPLIREPVDSIRKKQAWRIAEKQVRYLQGTMSLEKQEPDQKLIRELLQDKEEELLRSPGNKLWQDL